MLIVKLFVSHLGLFFVANREETLSLPSPSFPENGKAGFFRISWLAFLSTHEGCNLTPAARFVRIDCAVIVPMAVGWGLPPKGVPTRRVLY